MSNYDKNALTALYASMDFMAANDIDTAQVLEAIIFIENKNS